MESANNQTQNNKRTFEIDIVAMIIKVLKAPKALTAFIVVFAVLGVVVALNTPKNYTATAVLAPEISGSSGLSGSISDIASSFGIELGGTGGGMDAIYPEIYPDVLSSTDFLLKLLDVPVRLKENDTIRTYEQHLKKDCKVGLLDWPKVFLTKVLKSEEEKKDEQKVINATDSFKISRQRSKICDGLVKNITCLVDKKTSVITLAMSDQDPLVAAIMIDTIQHRLQNYIIEYRTKKSKKDYSYYLGLYEESKTKYDEIQKEYVNYCEANQDLQLEGFVVKRDDLENQMQNAYNVMTQLQTQVQLAEAKIRENTPAFTVIAKPKMAYKASSMPRSATVLIFIFIGVLLDTVFVNFIRKNKSKTPKTT